MDEGKIENIDAEKQKNSRKYVEQIGFKYFPLIFFKKENRRNREAGEQLQNKCGIDKNFFEASRQNDYRSNHRMGKNSSYRNSFFIIDCQWSP